MGQIAMAVKWPSVAISSMGRRLYITVLAGRSMGTWAEVRG